MEEKTKKEKETYLVGIGPLLKEILDEQKENIKKATYECVEPSYYEAGEIVAKKIIDWGGLKNAKTKAV